MMDETLAPYACDKCQSRKVSCSRGRPGCQRCKDEDSLCTYSRSGVIRRNRKRKHETPGGHPSSAGTTLVRPQSITANPTTAIRKEHSNDDPSGTNGSSQLATDIEVTRQRLHGNSQHDSGALGALSSLSDAYAAVWHNPSEFEKTGKEYFLFEDRAATWADTFVATLERGVPFIEHVPPPEVLEHLRASRPQQVHERAWLVMYYSIILSMVSSTDPTDETTKAKLRCNLWLALNDVKLFLEPSERNIQALVLLACHVEEFTTPSLCWMLVANACRMLQALGVNHRRFDTRTRERRTIMFWHLNIVDKGLALIFGRPPTLHQAMAREMPLPTLGQFLHCQPHCTPADAPTLFGAHFFYQVILLSRNLGDVWNCMYENATPDDRKIESARADLETWYSQARQVLEASAMVEKPFRDAKSAASIELGLHFINFNYHYLLILLARSSSRIKAQCLDSSKKMLHLLQYLVSDSEEVFNGIVWQLICCPFTPFLTLFGEIISNAQGESTENEEALVAMEQLPVFLGQMSLRNSLAAKLERISVVFVQHGRSVVRPQDSGAREAAQGSGILMDTLPGAWPSTGNMLHWESLFKHAETAPILSGNDDAQPTDFDLATWTDDFFGDAVFDWMGCDSQI